MMSLMKTINIPPRKVVAFSSRRRILASVIIMIIFFSMFFFYNPYIPIYNSYFPILLVFGLILCLIIAIPLSWIICRQAAFPDARRCFHMRMDQGHVLRTPWYDLYLPHSDDPTSLSKTTEYCQQQVL